MNFSLDFDGIVGCWLFGFALKMRMRNGIAKCIHAPDHLKSGNIPNFQFLNQENTFD